MTTEDLKKQIETQVPITELTQTIDEIIYNYTQYLLTDKNRNGAMDKEAEQLHYLKLIKEEILNKL